MDTIGVAYASAALAECHAHARWRAAIDTGADGRAAAALADWGAAVSATRRAAILDNCYLCGNPIGDRDYARQCGDRQACAARQGLCVVCFRKGYPIENNGVCAHCNARLGLSSRWRDFSGSEVNL